MNLNNSNTSFQDFMKCDFNKHWSFSNFNRQLMTASVIKDFQVQLGKPLMVTELGAGDSKIMDICTDNFELEYNVWAKYDANDKYEDCIVVDIASDEMEKGLDFLKPDVILAEEVLEHLSEDQVDKVLKMCYNNISKNGLFIVSVPTPPFNKLYEDRVWPDDHEKEYSYFEIYSKLNKYFKIENSFGWSMENREFNDAIKTSKFARKVYCRLKGVFPDSYIRALMPALVDVRKCRQVLFVCKKRRKEVE